MCAHPRLDGAGGHVRVCGCVRRFTLSVDS